MAMRPPNISLLTTCMLLTAAGIRQGFNTLHQIGNVGSYEGITGG